MAKALSVYSRCTLHLVEAVEVVRRGKVRRAKLYYLRDLRGKSARIVENTNVRAKSSNDIERQAFLG